MTETVKITGGNEFLHFMQDLPKQVRFATAKAINQTAGDVQGPGGQQASARRIPRCATAAHPGRSRERNSDSTCALLQRARI